MEASDSQPLSTEASAPEEIYLSVEEIERLKILLGKKQHEPKTAFGRLIISFFRFLDLMLDNTSRAWMYLLEVVGALSVFMFVWMFADGIHIIKHATDEKTIQKGQALIDAVKIAAESTNLIIGGLSIALPALIGMLRARKRTSHESMGIQRPTLGYAFRKISYAMRRYSPRGTVDR